MERNLLVDSLPWQLVLASQSPRRQQLLQELDLPFRVETRPVDEVWPDHLDVEQVATYLAELKAKAFHDIGENELVITADTVVVTETEILNKPADASEAKRMLSALSGAEHRVITGVCLKSKGFQQSFSASTTVHFAELTSAEIDYYIAKYKPFDKAGSYGIQEWIGKIGISRIEGDYFNVVGLPLQQLWQVLSALAQQHANN